MDRSVTAQATEKGVLAVLAGTPLATAAADLADAIKLYRAAGRAVLEAQTDSRGWYQVRVEFADWDTAEHAVATHLWPKLAQAETAGVVSSWWYIRKAPCWRLRFQAGTTSLARMEEFVLAVREIWRCWRSGDPLDFQGEFYRHSLMLPDCTPDHAAQRAVTGMLTGSRRASVRRKCEISRRSLSAVPASTSVPPRALVIASAAVST